MNASSSNKPLILVSNDDGIFAPGIRHLWESMHEIADLIVVAPQVEQSAVSLGITIRHPLRLEKVEWSNGANNIWSVNGTPADCVKMALSVLLPRKPDLIISGINRGSNAGRNVLYSGTVAAVIEGVFQFVPGVAFSLSDFFDPNYEAVVDTIPSIVDYAMNHPLPFGTFLNVNFPQQKDGPLKGIKLTHQGQEHMIENPELRHHPIEGHPYYWMGAKTASYEEEEDCDITWLSKGYASVVPIYVANLTHREHLKSAKGNFEKLFL